MKKTAILAAAAAVTLGSCTQKTLAPATADETGKIQTVEINATSRLYVYNSMDAMYDASFIVEGIDSLVLLETPLFKDASAEFEAFVNKIGKPVAAVITDYHKGGYHHAHDIVAEGFAEFMEGPVYGGMMQNFQNIWAGQLVDIHSHEGAEEVAFGHSKTIAGVTFRFEHGASSDFPAASIIIADKVYLMHWAPVEMHISPLQVGSRAAIDAEIAETQNALGSGCDVFVGGHSGLSSREALEWKISYLDTLRAALAENATAEEWQQAILAAYPELPGADNLAGLAKAFYGE